MDLIQARKLWENGTFVGDCPTLFSFPCGRFSGGTPRLAWLVPQPGCCGSPEGWTLQLNSPYPTLVENTANGILQGVWIEYDGYGVLIDAITVANVTDICNECCGEASVVTPRYNGVFPSVADIEPTLWTIVRTDEGSQLSLQRAMLDYLGQYIEGTFARTGYAGGDSTYTMQSTGTVHPIGTDTSTETARTFDSNAPGAPGVGNHLVANATINGIAQPQLDDDAYDAMSDVLTAVQGNATWAAWGTWTLVSGALHLSSTTANTASIVVTIVVD